MKQGSRQRLNTVILASGSKARAALLRKAGVKFTIQPASIDEVSIKEMMSLEGRTVAETAQTLADLKAETISKLEKSAFVIGSDQMLECSGSWLSKPSTISIARDQLMLLRGQSHHLVSAVSVALGGQTVWRYCSNSRLKMRHFSDKFLESYLASQKTETSDSVGGYKLEGMGVQLFSEIEGAYFDILGLPLIALLEFLREKGVLVE